MRDVAFYLAVGSLFTHELDAVPNNEWRALPLLEALPDETRLLVFIGWVGQAAYEFSSTLSNRLIFGGSAFGALYLLLEARQRLAARA